MRKEFRRGQILLPHSSLLTPLNFFFTPERGNRRTPTGPAMLTLICLWLV